MATTNRRAIMQDLHSYYSSKGVTDYASRIGELFCLLVTNEVSCQVRIEITKFSQRVTSIITEDTELLRLMDVYQQPRFWIILSDQDCDIYDHKPSWKNSLPHLRRELNPKLRSVRNLLTFASIFLVVPVVTLYEHKRVMNLLLIFISSILLGEHI